MSEIKGQLLGVILVVVVFGAVAGVMLNAFNKAAANTYNKIATDNTITPVNPDTSSNIGNLVF